MKELDDVTGAIVDASLNIHKSLGPELLESVYDLVLAQTLARRGLHVERQKVVRFECNGLILEDGLGIDLRVDARVFVARKPVEKHAPVHGKQVLAYLCLMDLPVGLLINFGAATLKEGLHRIVHTLLASWSPHLRVDSSAL